MFIAFLIYKLVKPLVEFAGLILLLILVSYGVTEYAEDIIQYFQQLAS
jgi:hypothetical protein